MLKVKDLLGTDDEVLFTGSYNINDENDQGTLATFNFNVSVNENGDNILSAESQSVNKKGEPKQKYLCETYTVSSYDNKNKQKKLGQITWNGLYKDNSSQGNTTSNSIEKFALTSSNGMYKKVKSVIIKFTYPMRKIYFIGNK
jgi:hypothetical protein